jgi:2-polyprenyl-3-methyl-5-hydroxy-6-metoxy-1,4-benzoquinol methylase
MRDWHGYWNAAAITRSSDLLQQVGKTVEGVPVPESHVGLMVQSIVARLQLSSADRVLDLCCGNGLLTRACAAQCASVTGVDFSVRLVDVARTASTVPGTRYVIADVCELPHDLLAEQFDAIYMYEALQHFAPNQVGKLLQALASSRSASAQLFFGSVPDADRIWSFYDTPARRTEYARRKAEGTEAIGYWWERSELEQLAKQYGYRTEFTLPHPDLHGAHYRFDALLQPAE